MTMKPLLILLTAGVALSGCAGAPVSNWEGLSTDTTPAAGAIDCGSFPIPDDVVGDSGVYSNAGLNDLERFRACSADNAAIVDLHAQQIAELKQARNALTEAGRAQERIAAMRLEMLEDERRHNAWQSIGYWVVIIALGAAAL